MYEIRHLPWNLRILLTGIVEALAFGLLVFLLPGIITSGWGWVTGTLAIAYVGALNALIRPVLTLFGLSPSLPVFGLGALLFNSLLFWVGHHFVAGFTVSGFWSPLLGVSGMALVNVSFSDLLAIDDDDSFYEHLVGEIVKRTSKPDECETPGVLFLEIDGLSEPVMQRAIRAGYMPTLARWLETGTHRLVRWECDLSSQTSASQAGILLGDNFDVPAFRWYEKDNQRRMVSNRPLDSAELERRLSTGAGLLAQQGASRGNMFSGDAPHAVFTFSTLTDLTRSSSRDFYPLLVGPYNTLRMILLYLWDLILEWRAARHQRRHDVRPRVHRGGVYPLLRASTTVLMREINVCILIGDMIAGVPCVYATFVGYDEVAHHSGVERPDALDVLRKLDLQFDRLARAARLAPRPYHFVLLSDHGQSQGATFKQRYGLTLEELVRTLVSVEHTVDSVESEDAGWGNLSVYLTNLLRDILPGSEQLAARLLRRFAKNRTYLDQVVLGPYRDFLKRHGLSSDPAPADVLVLASGNLGLIYLTDWDERLSYEQINAAFPNLIQGLAQQEGIGFVLVHSEQHGPLAIGAQGIHYLDSNRVEGADPLTHFGPHAALHLKRTNSFPHVADIMVNSFYDPETGEVAAFEELVGSHGGLGGDQAYPFVMFPSEWEVQEQPIIGAAALHAQLKHWLQQQSL